ncbi:MAG: rhomboid family intramembrane serine protease [Candidatus Bathyarchaeia archaeon]
MSLERSTLKATLTLMLVAVVLSMAVWSAGAGGAASALTYSYANLLEGKVWTLLTSLFIHASLLHLLGNLLFLFVFGSAVEGELGAPKMLGGFFLGGALSFVLSSAFYPSETAMVGASAAIFTLAAVATLVKPLRFSWILLSPIGLVAIVYFLYNALAVYGRVLSEVSYIGHLIGFAVGFALGAAWSRRWRVNLLIAVALLVAYFAAFKLIMWLLGG